MCGKKFPGGAEVGSQRPVAAGFAGGCGTRRHRSGAVATTGRPELPVRLVSPGASPHLRCNLCEDTGALVGMGAGVVRQWVDGNPGDR